MRLVPLLVLLLAPAAAAQTPVPTGTLQGVVLDDTGETLPGATVLVEGTVLGAATNVDGEYRIVDVPPGTYTVTASFVGFEVLPVEGVAVRAGQTEAVSFTLAPGAVIECWGPLVYEPPMISTDPFAPRVITGEELARLPVR